MRTATVYDKNQAAANKQANLADDALVANIGPLKDTPFSLEYKNGKFFVLNKNEYNGQSFASADEAVAALTQNLAAVA